MIHCHVHEPFFKRIKFYRGLDNVIDVLVKLQDLKALALLAQVCLS